MWKPEEVVPRHKRRAVLLWTTLIVGIISYSTYTMYKGLKRREDPGTTFKLSNNIHQYPDLWVCLYVNYGCDERELQEECVNSSNATEGGETLAVFYPGGEYEQVIPGEQILAIDKGFCVEYETSTITTFLGQAPETSEYLTNSSFVCPQMSWYPGGYNDSKTCLAEGWGTHNEWIYITFKDAGTGSLSSEIPLPYTCITNGSTSREFTHVGIEVTKVERLSGDIDVTFEAKSVTTTTQKIEPNPDIARPYANLALLIYQETNSSLTIKEIDPLDLAELFGTVSGFWDLLLILWPIFFVASSRQAPHLKGRSFKKAVTKGIVSAMTAQSNKWTHHRDQALAAGARTNAGQDGRLRQ